MNRGFGRLVEHCSVRALRKLAQHILLLCEVSRSLLLHALLLLVQHASNLVLLVLECGLHEVAAAKLVLFSTLAVARVMRVVEAMLRSFILLLAL